MRYVAKIRLAQGSIPITIPSFKAQDIREAAKIIRTKHGLNTDSPHRGFVITEFHI